MAYIEVVPAYGRDYTNQKSVQADWDAGKDFMVASFGASGYLNKQDALNAGIKVIIRYAKQMKVYSPK